MDTFKLNIITPDKQYAQKEAESLTLTTQEGEMTLLAHHIDIIANIEICPLIIKNNGHIQHFATGGGALNFAHHDNIATLLLTSVESFDEIDLQRAIASKVQAEKLMGEAKTTRDYNHAEIMLKRAINRINIKNNKKDA
ncbi:MAG: F0F1 ATP synthase subunit epsilon [Bacilli bacterium]|jgi:F-type H+-transporting ATPase subunit epsilon